MTTEPLAEIGSFPSDMATAADLGRRDAERTPKPYDLSSGTLVVARLHDDEHLAELDLERHLPMPLRARGSATLHDPADFAGYVNRLGDPGHTTVWADLDKLRITAVFDDHVDYYSAGWRSHTAMLQLQADPDWQSWIGYTGKLLPQADFAEFLEQQMHCITSPPAADMYEVATTLQAQRSVSYRSGVRLKSGDVQLTYDESTDAKAGNKGTLEIPDEFTVLLAPFAHTDAVEVTAKLRYRISNGGLHIGYQLIQPHIVKRDAFAVIVGNLRGRLDNAVGVDVMLGTPPGPTPL